ncbi:MAG: hypothetical protein GF400_00880 [Candidatus Eisenbacteria bacterium]|nr:hypothetical protein [Candidatus Eisenbacteria bacterium]
MTRPTGDRSEERRVPESGDSRSRLVARLLLPVAAVSAASSLLGVRLASPFTVDDLPTALLVFLAAPSLVIIAAGLAHRLLAALIASVLPFAWLLVVAGADAAPALWAIPIASAAIIAYLTLSRGSTLATRFAGALAVLVLLFVMLAPPRATARKTEAVLIGIDGASWQCVDMARQAGRMPNFDRLIPDGHTAKLRSLPSMLSPQVWSAIATGCGPEVNGIYGWAASQNSFQVGRVWDRMWLDGRTAGTCGWYFTWPPPEGLSENDFVVPSTLAPDSSTLPEHCGFFWEVWASESGRAVSNTSYVTAVLGALRSGVRLSTLREAVALRLSGLDDDPLGLESAWKKRRLSAAIQSDMFAELLRARSPELGVVMFNQVDKVSHLYWKFLEPESFPDVSEEEARRYGGAIEALYAEADRCVGKILDVLPEDAHVMIVSDHGFRPALQKVMGSFCRLRTENLLKALGADEDFLGSNLGQQVFLEPVSPDPAEADRLFADLEGRLETVHLEGERGPFLEFERDGGVLVIEIAARNAVPRDARVVVGGELHPFDALVKARQEALFSGVHAPDGVYLLAGPRAAEAADTDSLSVVDVAPTMAAILGLPHAVHWTGAPALDSASLDDMREAEYPPPVALAEAREVGGTEQLKEKLRSLGYLE